MKANLMEEKQYIYPVEKTQRNWAFFFIFKKLKMKFYVLIPNTPSSRKFMMFGSFWCPFHD